MGPESSVGRVEILFDQVNLQLAKDINSRLGCMSRCGSPAPANKLQRQVMTKTSSTFAVQSGSVANYSIASLSVHLVFLSLTSVFFISHRGGERARAYGQYKPIALLLPDQVTY